MTVDSKTKYAGADWLIKQMEYVKPGLVVSDLGKSVADLLGELFGGIYHLDHKSLNKVDWSNKNYIEISIGWQSWSTVDFDQLTRLVFLAHHMAIRVDLTPTKYQFVRLLFHQRGRVGNNSERHPTLDEAVEKFKKNVSFAEVHNDSQSDNT